MSPDDPRHGTTAGYSKHHRDGEEACQPCKTAATERAAAHRDTEPVALTGGRWVVVRGILRWRPDPEVAAAPVPVACRRCGARADQSCRSRNGHRVNPHRERHIPRQCSCGAAVKPSHRLCDDCKLEANRRSSAVWTERRRTAA